MKTVLVVEDEYALLNVIALTLEANGFIVHRAGDGEAALAVLRQAAVDVVLADSTMPVLGGLGLLSAMREVPALAAMPFILMLAAHERPSEVEVFVLPKPFTTTALLDAVSRAVTPRRE